MSVIQVDESEVPKDKLINPQQITPGQLVSIYYFKIVFDLNKDYDFTNDKVFYQYFQMPYYNSGPTNQLELPIRYIDEKENENAIKLSYNIGLNLKTVPGRPPYSSQIGLEKVPIPQSIIVYGLKVFETQINLGTETTYSWIVDENLNGVFDSNDIWAVDLNKDKEWDINSYFTIEKFKLSESVNINGKSYLIKEINPIHNSIKIAESKTPVKPREIFGVGSKSPQFARFDFISRKMITSLDIKGKPYVLYYISRYFDQSNAKELQNVVSILDKYIGLKKMSLIFAFDDSNFDKIIEALSLVDEPYYLINASASEASKRSGVERKHLLNGFKIDEHTLSNQKALIAVDKNGLIQYLNKDANIDDIVKVCEILKPGSSKGRAESKLKKFLRLFKKEEKVILELPSKPQTDVEEVFDWVHNNKKVVNGIFKPRHIVYIAGFCCDISFFTKTLDKNDSVKIPTSDSVYWIHFPRFSYDREKLYLLICNKNDYKNHIVSFSSSGKTKDIISLEGTIVSYDISPDESEVVYSQKGETLTHLYRQIIGSNKATQISENDIGGVFPAYSPDGKWVSYCAQRKLRLYNLKTGERKILVDDELMKEFPEWSPDGKWIVYQASAENEYLYDIYKVEFATGKVVRLTKELGTDANPYFSKDGSKIIFVSERDTGTNNQTIYMMNADGTDVKRYVTADTGVYFPRW